MRWTLAVDIDGTITENGTAPYTWGPWELSGAWPRWATGWCM